MSAAAGERRLVVDRLEGETVVVEAEGGGTLDLPRWLLPPGVREGDHLVATAGPDGEAGWRVAVRVDEAASRAARDAAAATLDRLRARDPGGDLSL